MISQMSDEEKKKISEQHKEAQRKIQEKIELNKKGLQQPKKES